MWAVLLYDRALTQVDSLAKSVTPQASPTERGGGYGGMLSQNLLSQNQSFWSESLNGWEIMASVWECKIEFVRVSQSRNQYMRLEALMSALCGFLKGLNMSK